jgi:hypothetical protein
VVGDDPLLDADAASRPGLFGVWISHGRRWVTRQPADTCVEARRFSLSPLAAAAAHKVAHAG